MLRCDIYIFFYMTHKCWWSRANVPMLSLVRTCRCCFYLFIVSLQCFTQYEFSVFHCVLYKNYLRNMCLWNVERKFERNCYLSCVMSGYARRFHFVSVSRMYFCVVPPLNKHTSQHITRVTENVSQ